MKPKLLIGVFALLLFAAYSAWLYVAAPVGTLKGSVTYTPIHAKATRTVGLAAKDAIAYDAIPAELTIAITAREDSYFFQHGGVSWPDLQEAIGDFFDGEGLRGASTISQQLVKNAFLSPERSLWRKYKEMLWALKLEKQFSKQQIFSMYASLAEIAPGVYGVREGARHYFGKELRALTPAECAFLATVIHAPSWSEAALRSPKLLPGLQDRTENTAVKMLTVRHYVMSMYAPDPNHDDGHLAQYFAAYEHIAKNNSQYSIYYRPFAVPTDEETASIKQEADRITAELFAKDFTRRPALAAPSDASHSPDPSGR